LRYSISGAPVKFSKIAAGAVHGGDDTYFHAQ
jgi:hypothetical protein